MKWDCGPTAAEKWEADQARLSDWHSFFALWPRRVGLRDCRWLETIERKGTRMRRTRFAHGLPYPVEVWDWEYRAKP